MITSADLLLLAVPFVGLCLQLTLHVNVQIGPMQLPDC